jgi:hypothetical protein
MSATFVATLAGNVIIDNPQLDPSVRSLSSIPRLDPSARSLGSIPRLDPSARSLGSIPQLDPSARSLGSIPRHGLASESVLVEFDRTFLAMDPHDVFFCNSISLIYLQTLTKMNAWQFL